MDADDGFDLERRHPAEEGRRRHGAAARQGTREAVDGGGHLALGRRRSPNGTVGTPLDDKSYAFLSDPLPAGCDALLLEFCENQAPLFTSRAWAAVHTIFSRTSTRRSSARPTGGSRTRVPRRRALLAHARRPRRRAAGDDRRADDRGAQPLVDRPQLGRRSASSPRSGPSSTSARRAGTTRAARRREQWVRGVAEKEGRADKLRSCDKLLRSEAVVNDARGLVLRAADEAEAVGQQHQAVQEVRVG